MNAPIVRLRWANRAQRCARPSAATNRSAPAAARAVSFFKSFALDFHPISRLNLWTLKKSVDLFIKTAVFYEALNYDVAWSGLNFALNNIFFEDTSHMFYHFKRVKQY